MSDFSGASILNANPKSFWHAWLFSFQTSATIGYGYLLPGTMFANVIVIFDANIRMVAVLPQVTPEGIPFIKLVDLELEGNCELSTIENLTM